MKFERASGILLHITSLPSKYGIGSFGKEAYAFVDFLEKSGQKLWQIFPLGPTGYGNSPYQTFSAFAGSPLLIDLDLLVTDGLINENDIPGLEFKQTRVEYDKVSKFKLKILYEAFKNFQPSPEFETFTKNNSWWLDDYALFMSIRKKFHYQSWVNWPQNIKLREQDALNQYKEELNKSIYFQKFLQFKFKQQVDNLHQYANSKGVKIIGDIPIFIGFDSSDVWANPAMFHFDKDCNPTIVAGCPPDEFAPTGQLWGNPLYRWQVMKENGFKWWIKRFEHLLTQVDIIRIDHFIGFVHYWAVPAGDKTALNGEWKQALGDEMFATLEQKLGKLPIIAEDLGAISDAVIALRDKYDFPGMKILQFAFYGDKENPYLPHNFDENCVVYTGTHDNETTRGWYSNLDTKVKKFVDEYLEFEKGKISWELIKAAWKSKADMALAPMQDFLDLDNKARMNYPGTVEDNWEWRVKKEQLQPELAKKIRTLTQKTNRLI